MGSVLVVTSHSYAAVSSDGSSLTVGLTATARGKRSVDRSPRWKRSAADQVYVQTPSGEWWVGGRVNGWVGGG